MEYSPPPLFKQGASARAKVIVFTLVAIVLLVVDSRVRSLSAIRQVVGVALYPMQAVALLPRDAAYAAGGYFSSLSKLQNENGVLKVQHTANAQLLQQGQLLVAENAHLRKLLGASERLPVKSVMAEILYDARDVFTRKIIVDRGAQHGVEAGQPVIDELGVVGQVTRVFPFTSEITLLTDKDQAIPVQVVRSGLRSVAYGQGRAGTLDLRFMPVNADIKNGDILVTSGLDGIYPAGLAVAKVTQVASKSSDAFARIVCQPMAGTDRNRQLLILLSEPNPAMPLHAAAQQTDNTVNQQGKKALTANASKEAPAAPAVSKEQIKQVAQPGNAQIAPQTAARAPAAPQAPVKPAPVKQAPVKQAPVKQATADPAPTAAPAMATQPNRAAAEAAGGIQLAPEQRAVIQKAVAP